MGTASINSSAQGKYQENCFFPTKKPGITIPVNNFLCSFDFFKMDPGPSLNREVIEMLPVSYCQNIANAAEKVLRPMVPNHTKLGSCTLSIDESRIQKQSFVAFLQEITKAISYVRRLQKGTSPDDPYLEKLAFDIQEIVEAVIHKPEPKTSNVISNINACVNLSSDSISLARNILRCIDTIGPENPITKQMGFSLLPLMFLSSFFSLRGAYNDRQRASILKDKEGLDESTTNGINGLLLLTGTSAWGASTLLPTTNQVFLSLGSTATGVFGIGSFLSLGIACCKIARAHRFRERLHEYMDNEQLTLEQRVYGSVQFLKDQIWLTEEEKKAMIEKCRGASQEVVERTVKEKVLTKINRLKRRTCTASFKEIIQKTPTILQKMEHCDSKIRAEGLLEGQELIHNVKKENAKKLFYYSLVILASLVGIASLIAGTIFSAGLLPLILGAISSGIWVVLGVNGVYLYIKTRWQHELNSGSMANDPLSVIIAKSK